MTKKTFGIGTVTVSIIFVCAALILNSVTHTGLSSAGSYKSSYLGELEKPVFLTFNVDGINFSIATVGSEFTVHSVNNDVERTEEDEPDHWLVDLKGNIEEVRNKEKQITHYRIVLTGNYLRSKSKFLTVLHGKEAVILELNEDAYKFNVEVGTDLIPGTPQIIATQGTVEMAVQLDKI